MRRRTRRGSTLVEFVLAGIPILLTVISVIEISRCMWTYNTLTYAVKEGTRMAIVHGENCSTAPNICSTTVGAIAQRLADSSQGLLADQINISGTITCSPLSSCLGSSSPWPALPIGTNIRITAAYPFDSPIGIFFPGSAISTPFPAVTLRASSQQRIQF